MERVMSELAEYFVSSSDYEVHLVLYGISREEFYRVNERILIHKPEFAFNNSLRVASSLRTMLFLRRKVREIDPVTVLSFGEYWNSFVLLSLIFRSFPVYISDRCSPAKKFGFPHALLRRILYPMADGIIAQTEKAKEIYASQSLNRNIRVIGNPVRAIRNTNGTQRENSVLMVGRLISSKHQDKLIELFLKIDAPEWKLVLVGYDHLQQKHYNRLEAMIARDGAQKRVILAGKISDVDQYYNRSKIFAFTSSSEGFPNAIGEAMSAGLPVVAFDCVAGPSEMIKDNHNGYLIPLFDYSLFREKLEMLMKDNELTAMFGNNAMSDIKRYSLPVIGEEYLEFITERNLLNINKKKT